MRTLAKAAELMTTHQAGKMRGRRGRQATTGSLTKSWDVIFNSIVRKITVTTDMITLAMVKMRRVRIPEG